jgi:CDP-glycerol glycerophosphotransferase
MSSPRISVVVPFFNNVDLLGECLKSIAAQSFTDLEVIMVDDGSADGSALIAQSQAEADPRFRVIRIPNGGPGRARNKGVELARGEFLAFVDADDVLPRSCYELLLHTLERSGSDFVSGGVERLMPYGLVRSGLHSQAIKDYKIGTHISRSPELFYDISVWNKLFRKQFWDAHQLRYPEGMVWEDIQLMTKAHVLARQVDVIPDTIYHWRARDKGGLSITQSRTDLKNLQDRVDALLAIDAFLSGHGKRLLRHHQRKALVNDLWMYVGDLARTSGSYQREFARLGARYLHQVDRRVLSRLPAPHKLAYHLLAAGRITELVEFSIWLTEQPTGTLPVVRRLGRLQADLPYRNDPDLKIPAKVYRPYWRELDPFVRVERICWDRGRLVISGCAFVHSIDITKRRHTSKFVMLRPVTGGRLRPPLVIPARSFRHDEATAWSHQERYSYDWAGFRSAISPRMFRAGRRWLTGEWDCFILVRAHGVWRPARLHTPMPGPAERPEFREVAPGIRLGARWLGQRLRLQVVSTPAVLSGCSQRGSALAVEVDAAMPDADSSPEVVLAASEGAATRVFPASAEPVGSGTFRLRAEIPLAALEAASVPPGQQARVLDAQPPGEPQSGVVWDVYTQTTGRKRVRVAFGAGQEEYRFVHGMDEVAVERTRYGNAVIARRSPRPVIHAHSWSSDGVLTLTGRYAAVPEDVCEIVLRKQGSNDQHVVPVRCDGDTFTASIEATGMEMFGRRAPLRDGRWDFVLRRTAQDGSTAVMVPAYDHARLSQLDEDEQVFGRKTYRFTTAGYDAPIIIVAPALKLTEHGRLQRRMLRGLYYPVQVKRPLREDILFISWKGKQCEDNPRGIADELRRRGDERPHIWAVSDWSIPVPDGARGVLTGTEEYWEAIARSRFVISNDDMPASYVKRPGQVYVQTWHGTPLKRIGFDIDNPQFVSGAGYLNHLAADVAKWDLLLSPNPFSTPIMRRAFRYDGEICESGYPRNDLLNSPGSAELAARIRHRLGVPQSKRIVLYAPTWRDDQYYASGRYRFDFRLDLERAWRDLGDGYVVLIRGHHHMADDVPAGRPGFAINVTRYPDITELFLVTDVLVTDYSSVMFDFAPTGRPMVFYTYDLEEYRDKLRGFYIDFEAEAPGPLLATSAEIYAAIADIGSVAARYRDAYTAFRAKYCPLDDGKAAVRACDRIFQS